MFVLGKRFREEKDGKNRLTHKHKKRHSGLFSLKKGRTKQNKTKNNKPRNDRQQEGGPVTPGARAVGQEKVELGNK